MQYKQVKASDYENTENNTKNGKTNKYTIDCNNQYYTGSDLWMTIQKEKQKARKNHPGLAVT